MTVYQVTLKTLTPLHIGDGDTLRQDFDFAAVNGRTYRLNEDAILLAKEAQWAASAGGNYPLPGKLLSEGDYKNTALFRYVVPGVPRSGKTFAEVRSFIKDVFDRPYLPGSTLKGALRTALAWTGWAEVKPPLDRGAVGRNRSWAAQPLEKKLFGPDPNHDLLRALHVSDLFGPEKAGEGLMLVNAQVLTKKSAGSPVELEAVKSGVLFHGTLTIDETLFGPLAERELHFANRKHWLMELMLRAQAHSRARIERLAAWYEQAEGCEAIARFYRQMQAAQVGNNAALIQIAWGAGWDGKTFSTHLQADPQLFEQLVSDFRLHKAGRGSPPRKAGDPFPRSKRVAMDKAEKPGAPLGWVLVELTPVGEPSAEWAAMMRRSQPPAGDALPSQARPPLLVKPTPAPLATSVSSTEESASPAPPRPPKPAPRPLTSSFTAPPNMGDRFKGEVFEVEGRRLLLSIPGLEDTVAYAVIEPEDNPGSKRIREGESVICEVAALTQEKSGCWRVRCRKG